MSLKDATTNMLLMFVAATCVVLVVKAVTPPPQPPQVIVTSAGGSGDAIQAKAGGPEAPAARDGVRVYYLHGNTRCPTCRSIEAYAEEAVKTGFASELQSGKVQWQVINYDAPGNEHFAQDYDVAAPIVVLAKVEGGKQTSWKGLPEVWEHVGDKAVFLKFVQGKLREFLGGPEEPNPPQAARATPEPPLPSLPIPE